MRRLIFTLLLCSAALGLKDLGAPNWSCDASVMAKSKKVPTSAHSVRFADIKVIGALGDSLTAANGAGAPPGDPLAVILQYRGLAFQIGGDKSLDEHITIANVLRKFNPNLVGASKGIGSENVWEVAHLNMGVPGAESKDIIGQARALVNTMHSHSEINVKEDWKLVNIFIGANDICVYCEDPYFNSTAPHGKTTFENNIITAVKILHDNLPRYFSRKHHRNSKYLQDNCFFDWNVQYENVEENRQEEDGEKDIQNTGLFDDKDDFTFVVQPFFNGILDPPYSVGFKQTSVNLSDPTVGLHCPSANCPFFPTTKNSKDCASHFTLSELD
ncbi:hypothetical protein CAEBREN_29302 [Caenorhabditis brenneri]|uniref:SGNH hydrolase-type esterase domain-containing protein n=1 Tax=Caenorhabditis brenneri TaxID=135651 RepID=G0PEG9_CAEBE|nr:hypothetical protein CAEBREN_29302 [Caenorhabditis brenneri]